MAARHTLFHTLPNVKGRLCCTTHDTTSAMMDCAVPAIGHSMVAVLAKVCRGQKRVGHLNSKHTVMIDLSFNHVGCMSIVAIVTQFDMQPVEAKVFPA